MASTIQNHNPWEKCKVLLVEDNPIVQKVHLMMLEKAGCDVDLAEDGPKALSLIENNYDLILMDIGLPGMSGLDVTTQIRKRERNGFRTPIITLTAYSNEHSRNDSLAAGSDDVVLKPIPFSVLGQLLKRWVKQPSNREEPSN